MKNWKKHLALLLALLLCLSLSACGGEEEAPEEEAPEVEVPEEKAPEEDVVEEEDGLAPATIDDLVLGSDDDFDYSLYMGSWLDEDENVLAVQYYDDDARVHFTISGDDGLYSAAGVLQYVEAYGFVYAYNDYDGVAYQCWFDEADAMHIETLGVFTQVSGDAPGENIGDLPETSDFAGLWAYFGGFGESSGMWVEIWEDGRLGRHRRRRRDRPVRRAVGRGWQRHPALLRGCHRHNAFRAPR